jgi:HAE1 family hydrophobic/amphiphilic exporter-1
MTVQGVKELSSTSKQGSTTITIEFNLNKDIDIALQEVQTKLAQAQRNLPSGIDPPVISKSNPEDQPIMWLAFKGDRPFREMIDFAKGHLKDKFTTAPGVSEVILGGYLEPNLRVWLNNQKMIDRDLTVQDIINTIQTQHTEVPAGRIENPKQELNVRMLGEAATVNEFTRMIIQGRSGSPIWRTFRLGDVGRVEDGLDDIRRISRSGQKPTIGLGIRKQRGTNAVEVARGVKKRAAEIQKILPKGTSLEVVFDTTKFIEESTHELNTTLVLSAILTSIVCWLFLGSFSSALNVILAIPTSILGTFIFLHLFNFTLNTFTLLGLSLVIGIVVDDAIMVLENIVRHREMGESKMKAALVGAREITFAAAAASVAILAIFAPIVFMDGIMGKFFFQFGMTISVAVAISLLEALTLAPMRCSQFLQVGASNAIALWMEHSLENLSKSYHKILVACLNRRGLVLIGAFAFFFISIMLVKTLNKEFVPAQDQGRFLVRLQTKLGSSITFTDGVFKATEAKLVTLPGVEKYFAAVGGFGGGDVNTGFMFITMKSIDDRPDMVSGNKKIKVTQKMLMGMTRKALMQIPGVEKAIVQDLSLAGFSAQRGFPVEFNLRGPDWDQLGSLSEMLKKKMLDSGLMVDVDSDYLTGMPEVQIIPDREKADLHGVSMANIGTSIQALFGGLRVGKYTHDSKRYDVRVKLENNERLLSKDIKKIWVRNNRGELVRLSDIVNVVEKPTLLSITRKNRERSISLFANIAPGKSQGEAVAYVEKMTKEVLPEGYRAVFSGSSQTMKESSNSLMLALVLGIFVAYMVLASQFNSFLHPVLVLLALPFSITGAFIALKLTGLSLNMYSMIGILLLMGIVKKNSILLVDFTNEKRKLGLSVNEALLEACPIRLRPILMTSVATIAAAVPAAIGTGAGSETRMPMAVVIIGGVLVSTFLTLFVVPCAYSLTSRFEGQRHPEELKKALVEMGEKPTL